MVRSVRFNSIVSTHSRPKAAGGLPDLPNRNFFVSTHSRPKAAGRYLHSRRHRQAVSTHSRPKAAGSHNSLNATSVLPFQHTAARRRLGNQYAAIIQTAEVSTHSRPKAAGLAFVVKFANMIVSTHSRPKAAGTEPKPPSSDLGFQHTAARRRLAHQLTVILPHLSFQHTAARRRLVPI